MARWDIFSTTLTDIPICFSAQAAESPATPDPQIKTLIYLCYHSRIHALASHTRMKNYARAMERLSHLEVHVMEMSLGLYNKLNSQCRVCQYHLEHALLDSRPCHQHAPLISLERQICFFKRTCDGYE